MKVSIILRPQYNERVKLRLNNIVLNRDFSPYKIVGKQDWNYKLFYQTTSKEAEPLNRYQEYDIRLMEDQSLTFSSDIIDAPRKFWDLFNVIDFNFHYGKKKRVIRYFHLLAPLDSEKNIQLQY